MHNDTLLLLDELAQVDPRAAAQIAYMLANGKGKGRASRDGGARKISEWLTIFISTGEISLSTKMSEGGKHSTAGQEVRVLDIPADAGKGLGLLEELHGFKKPGALADALCDCARKNYGHAARAFLTELTKDVEGYTKEVRDTIDAVKERLCPPGADSQVGRAAARFALIAAAGELAIEFGVFPWPEGDAEKAAERCFNDWLRERGGPEQKEDKDAIERVIGFLRRESSRFRPWAMEFSPVPNCAGYSKDNPRRFYIYLTTFRDEICGKNGLDYRNAAKVLAEAGYLIKSSRSRYLRTERLPIEGNQEVYVIRLPQSTEEAEKEDGSTASYERQAE